jgi:hypothetical protein
MYPPTPSSGQVVAATDPEVRDFTHRRNVVFRIDDDVFTGRPGIPAARLLRFLGLMDEMNEKPQSEQTDLIRSAMTLMLTAESADVFNRRLDDDENPIDLDQVNEVQTWLMEQYGMRPTSPAGSSSDGQPGPDAGTSSTPDGSAPASTSSSSEPISSST